MLKLTDINAGYGSLKVLHGININIDEGELVALVGSNGAGKTTLLRVVSGLIPVTSGTVTWFGQDITNMPAYERPTLGIAHILQGRGILSTMSVYDNLLLGGFCKTARKDREKNIQKVYDLFPLLKQRSSSLAGSLSGGQQQMLAIARALMLNPRLLILDEPSLGLAPILVDEVYDIIRLFKEKGTSILLIEQNLVKALNIASRGYVVETGQVVMKGSGREILDNPDVKKAYLGI